MARIDNPFAQVGYQSGVEGSPWWPQTGTGQTFPTYAEFTKGLPDPAAWLRSTGFDVERNNPNYGKMPEGDVNKWFDIVAKENLQKGMEENAARFAEAGYAPQYNAAEATGRLLQGLEGKRAGLQYENAQSGLNRQSQLYGNILSAMANREQGIMAPYLSMFAKGIGTQGGGMNAYAQGAGGGAEVRQPGRITFGENGYGSIGQQPTKAVTQQAPPPQSPPEPPPDPNDWTRRPITVPDDPNNWWNRDFVNRNQYRWQATPEGD